MERGHGTVLVVDDQADVLEGIQNTLEAHGYQVLTATNGLAAVRAARGAAQLNLVLTDVILPGLDGTGVVKRIRETHPEMPAILMSSFPQDTNPPGTRFLSKPLDPDGLLVAVHEALSGA